MALPLLLGAAKGLIGSATKSTVKRKAKDTAKNFVSGKDGRKRGGALVKREKKEITKAKVKPTESFVGGSAATSSPSSSSTSKASITGGKIDYEKMTQQLESMVGVSEALKKAYADQYKEKEKESKKKDSARQKAKRENRESQLESKSTRSGSIGGNLMAMGDKFNIFGFLLNTLMGGLAVMFIKNFDTIKNFFSGFGEMFDEKMNFLKWGLISLRKPIQKVTNLVATVFRPFFKKMKKPLKRVITKVGTVVSGGLRKIGTGILNFTRNMLKKVSTGVRSGTAGAGGARSRSGTRGAANVARKGLRTGPASGAANKKFTRAGARRLVRFSGLFKRVPFVGPLIAIGIDMAMGESIDRAVVGAIGATLGAAILGVLGSVVPGVGNIIGGLAGAALGDFLAKKIYEDIKSKITGEDTEPLVNTDINPRTGLPYSESPGKSATEPPDSPSPSNKTVPTAGITKEQKSLLDAISFAEGTKKSYGTIFGGNVVPELAQGKLTIGQVLEMQRTGMLNGKSVGYGTSYKSDATGRYQFMSFVLEEEMQKQGYTLDTLFTPELQDKMILGRISRFRGVTPALLAKEGLSTKVLDMLAPEFASFPYSPKGGRSYYDQPVKTSSSIRDAYNKSLGISQSSQSTQPVSQTTPQAQVAQVSTSTTIQDLYRGGSNTAQFPTTSGYGMRKHPIHGDMRMHRGVDIAPPGPGYFVGLKVPGKVTRVSNDPGGYGKFVIITSQQTGMSYMFAHMATINVKVGDDYTGQPIGEMGTTGGSTGIHLHYEVYKGGKDGPEVDPTPYMNLLTMGKVGSESTTTTAKVAPTRSTSVQSARRVEQRASYEGGGSEVVTVPMPVATGGQQVSPYNEAGVGGMMMSGGSTKALLNSYYKSKLMGFLYKQG